MKHEGFTPGPWTVTPANMASGYTIADVDDTFKVIAGSPSKSGNAALIAAAPDLHAENERLRAALSEWVLACNCSSDSAVYPCALCQSTEAALAGGKGEK